MLELIAKAFELFGFLCWCFINCQLFILLEEKPTCPCHFFQASWNASFKAFTGPAGKFSGTGHTTFPSREKGTQTHEGYASTKTLIPF